MVHLGLPASQGALVARRHTARLFRTGFIGSSKWFHWVAKAGFAIDGGVRRQACRCFRFVRSSSPGAAIALGRETKMTKTMTRRVLLGAAAMTATTTFIRPARAAEFEFKLGANTPETHPLTVRLTEAARAIGEQSSGRLNVTVFANSQLGGD